MSPTNQHPIFRRPALDLIVLTDMDGTLLDHHNYAFDAARPALEQLASLGVPVIPVTSKTAVEVQTWEQRLMLNAPFIIENGAAMVCVDGYFGLTEGDTEVLPGYRVIRLSPAYAELRQQFCRWRDEYGFAMQGFGDWSVDEIASRTGLPPDDAAQAGQRLGSEPFIWQGTEQQLNQLRALIGAAGLHLEKGGRFYHLLGKTSKAVAAQSLLGFYAKQFNFQPATIALGDSPNDLSLLSVADYPVVIRRHDGSHMDCEIPGARFTTGIGPAGWNEAVLAILQEQGERHV